MTQVGLAFEDGLDLFRQAYADVSHDGTRACITFRHTLEDTGAMRVNRGQSAPSCTVTQGSDQANPLNPVGFAQKYRGCFVLTRTFFALKTRLEALLVSGRAAHNLRQGGCPW